MPPGLGDPYGQVYMFTGADNGCPHTDLDGRQSDIHVDRDRVIVWCGYFNHNPHGNDLGWWDYLYNPRWEKFGWVQDKYVQLDRPAHLTC